MEAFLKIPGSRFFWIYQQFQDDTDYFILILKTLCEFALICDILNQPES